MDDSPKKSVWTSPTTWMLYLTAIAVMAGIGWWAGQYRADVARTKVRDRLLRQATDITRVLDPELARQLTFTSNDKGNPAFEVLRERLIACGKGISSRGIFTISLRDEGVFFGPESYAEDDPLACPPGTAYREPPAETMAVFISRQPATVGPYSDEYGSFVTALAPLLDPQTGEVLLVVGLDVLPEVWQAQVNTTRHSAATISIVMVVLFLSSVCAAIWHNRRTAATNPRLKTWILVPVVLMLLAGTVLFISHEDETVRAESHRDTSHLLLRAGNGWSRLVSSKVALLQGQLSHLVRDPALQEAWLSQDAELLAVRSEPVFTEMKREFGITHFYFVASDRTCFLRVHQPGRRGDQIDRTTMLTAQRTGKEAWGLEMGPLGTFTLRCVRPWISNGEISGFLELGMEIDGLVEELARDLDVEIVSVTRKRCTSEESFETGKRAFGFTGEWCQYPEVVVTHQTIPVLPEELVDRFSAAKGPFDDEIFPVTEEGHRFRCGWVPLQDAAGCDVADLLVLQDATDQVETAWRGLWFSMGLGAAVCGILLTLLWSITDMAERTLDEAFSSMRASESRLRGITDSAQDAILTMDSEGSISYWNPAAQRILGYASDEALDRNLHELIAPGRYHEAHCAAFPEFCSSGNGAAVGKTLELEAVRKDGVEITVGLSLSAVNIGGQWHSVGILRDTTERKQMKEDLLSSNEELEQYVEALQSANQALEEFNSMAESATRAKSEFLANMSHEIRTPMTAILGYCDLLGESMDCCNKCPDHVTCETRIANSRNLQTIQRNGEHLLTLINDILDLSKIEAGKMEIALTRCSPVEVVEEAVSLIRVRAAEKQLGLTTDVAGPLPETVLTDPLRLHQVLVNVLGNAVKFTERGGIHVTTRLVEEGGCQRLRIDVADTGIGMQQEQVEQAFHAFSQVDSSVSRKATGTGLGLTISKRLVQALGGCIQVQSSPGKGSTLTILIDPGPLDGISMIESDATSAVQPPPPVVAVEASRIQNHCRILLAEDGPDNQRLIRHFLTRAGAEVTVVENGQLAVETALAAGEAGRAFDVILMDMQMPVIDGYTATQTLRDCGYSGPIVALTAHAMAEDRQKCLNAGCDDYVAKPIVRQKLLSVVAEYATSGKSTLAEAVELRKSGTTRYMNADKCACAFVKCASRIKERRRTMP